MRHTSNIRIFLAAASTDAHPLVRAYCGLVAIELLIKAEIGLVDHNVCAGLNKLRATRSIGTKSWSAVAMTGLIERLRNDITAIQVNSKAGLPVSAPADSYPYIRYLRLDVDGWPLPHTSVAAIQNLANTVQALRAFLKTTFGFPL